MEIRVNLMRRVFSYLFLRSTFRSETQVLRLATSQMRNTVNFGTVSGHSGLVNRPILSAATCENAFPIHCVANSRYRTIHGLCNNLQHNVLWGSQSSVFQRLLPAAYANDRYFPRGGFTSSSNTQCRRPPGRRSGGKKRRVCSTCSTRPGAQLPNPIWVSRMFHSAGKQDDYFITVLFIIFGQFLDHDITLTPEFEVEGGCCGANLDDKSRCFSVSRPNCVTFSRRATNARAPASGAGPGSNAECMSFARSSMFCNNTVGMRQQVNGLTAFIDASAVYGSTTNMSATLRTFRGGEMATNPFTNTLPFVNGDRSEVRAGDERVAENVLLSCLHTLFLREHNRLVKDIRRATPNGRDEFWFQEARRLVWAQFQSIVYQEYLPILLGDSVIRQNSLNITLLDPYNPSINAGIFNEFATAAYRYGHSGLPQVFEERFLNPGKPVIKRHNLQDNFFNLDLYNADNGRGFDRLMNGMMFRAARPIDRFVTSDVTRFLFANVNSLGQDLVARNIQRGRDHGLPGYNDYRAFCKLPKACNWHRKPKNIPLANWEILEKLYNTPSDIDLFVGGLAEVPFAGGLVGRTFSCILAKQFHALKFGDR